MLFLEQCIQLLETTISDNISLKSNFIKSSPPFSASNSTLSVHTVFVAQHMFLFSIFDYKNFLVVFPYLQFLNDKIDQNTFFHLLYLHSALLHWFKLLSRPVSWLFFITF